MKTKRYRLLKDLPDLEATENVIFERHGDITMPTHREYSYSTNIRRWYYPAGAVENNPEWFSPVKKLFMLPDGTVLYEGDEWWTVNKNNLAIFYHRKDQKEIWGGEKYRIFITKQEAEDYVNSHQSIKEEQPEERLRWSDRKKYKPVPKFPPGQAYPTKERDWEIVEMKNKYGERHVSILEVGNDWSAYLNKPMWEINKVKRLSDNETFSLGDELCELGWFNSDKAVINSITIINDYPSLNFGKNGARSLMSAKKSKPQPTKERTEVVDINFDCRKKWMEFFLNNEFSADDIKRVKHAIESAINGNNEVTFLSEYAGESFQYGFYSVKPIQPNQFELVKKAIEFALDDEHGWEAKVFGELVYKKIGMKMGEGFYVDEERMPLYTQQQVDEIEEAAFNEARLRHPGFPKVTGVKYITFQDYKKLKSGQPTNFTIAKPDSTET